MIGIMFKDLHKTKLKIITFILFVLCVSAISSAYSAWKIKQNESYRTLPITADADAIMNGGGASSLADNSSSETDETDTGSDTSNIDGGGTSSGGANIFSLVGNLVSGAITDVFLGLWEMLISLIMQAIVLTLLVISNLYLNAMAQISSDTLENWLGTAAGTDMTQFFTAVGLAMAALFAAWELLKFVWAGVSGEQPTTRPLTIITGTFLYGAWTACAIPTSKLLFNVGQSMFNAMYTGLYGNAGESFLTNMANSYVNSTESAIDGTVTGAFTAFSDGVLQIISLITGSILIILAIWNFLKFLFSMFTRFAILIFYIYLSPLAVSCGVSPKLRGITQSWFKNFITTMVLWCIDVWALYACLCLMQAGGIQTGAAWALWAGCCYGFAKSALHLDEIFQQLGMQVAQTRGGVLSDIGEIAKTALIAANVVAGAGAGLAGAAAAGHAGAGVGGALSAGAKAMFGGARSAGAQAAKAGVGAAKSVGFRQGMKEAIRNTGKSLSKTTPDALFGKAFKGIRNAATVNSPLGVAKSMMPTSNKALNGQFKDFMDKSANVQKAAKDYNRIVNNPNYKGMSVDEIGKKIRDNTDLNTTNTAKAYDKKTAANDALLDMRRRSVDGLSDARSELRECEGQIAGLQNKKAQGTLSQKETETLSNLQKAQGHLKDYISGQESFEKTRSVQANLDEDKRALNNGYQTYGDQITSLDNSGFVHKLNTAEGQDFLLQNTQLGDGQSAADAGFNEASSHITDSGALQTTFYRRDANGEVTARCETTRMTYDGGSKEVLSSSGGEFKGVARSDDVEKVYDRITQATPDGAVMESRGKHGETFTYEAHQVDSHSDGTTDWVIHKIGSDGSRATSNCNAKSGASVNEVLFEKAQLDRSDNPDDIQTHAINRPKKKKDK